MRIFSLNFFKNLIWIYLCILMCFSYTLFMKEIPNHIYINEGDPIVCPMTVPVTFEERKSGSGNAHGTTGESGGGDVLGTLGGTGETASGSYGNGSGNGGVQAAAPTFHSSDKNFVVTCRLFGLFPVKEVEVSVIPEQKVYASGRLVGIYGATSGVLVLDSTSVEAANGLNYEPAANRIMAGDYILAVNHREIKTKENLVDMVNTYGGEPMILTMNRKGQYIEVEVNPVPTKNGGYMLGIWVKDDIAGIGTMTYYTPTRDFGALGHGIGDGETGNLLSLGRGSIYRARLLGIKKGENGTPGELEGMIYYGDYNCLGFIEKNDELGIYGVLDEEDYRAYTGEDTLLPVGYKQEIQIGEACILSDISGTITPYQIRIDAVDYQAADSNKGIHFTVTDENLLRQTGGIVQGMSGSPIIQNGKMVGAVTHVLVRDPQKGYGIFAETMLEH